MGLTTWIILAKFCFLVVSGHYHNAHYEHWMRSASRRPVDVMTDVINDLSVQILQQYHMPGNVAFSPTGLGFVLIALYEGSAGRGSKQIGETLNLPHDRQITRIGLRDIHRRLRSYLNADGFLGGLNLNRDNTRLRPEFEDILRFYGFDFTIDGQNTTDSNTTDSNTTDSNTTDSNTTDSNTTDSNTTDSTAGTLAGITTIGNAVMSTMQPLANGVTTINPDGSMNQPAGNDATMTSTTLANSNGGNVTNGSTGVNGATGTNAATGANGAAGANGANGAASTSPPPGTALPNTDGTAPTTNGPTTSNAPSTTIDTSVDIITVTPGNAAPIVQAIPSSAATTNPLTTPIASTIERQDIPLNTTDMPARLSSLAAEPNLSTQMIVNNPGSASGPAMDRVASGGIVTTSTDRVDSFRFSAPFIAKTIIATESVTTTTEPTTAEPTTVETTTAEPTTSEPTTSEPTTTESTTTEPTTIQSRTTPARFTAFSLRSNTATARSSTLTVRSSSSTRFRTGPWFREPITSTMGSRMVNGGSTASMTELETVSVVVIYDSEPTARLSGSTTSMETTTTDLPTSTTTDLPSTTTDMPTSTTDEFATIMDSVMGAQTLSIVENPSSNKVRRRRSAEHYFSTYPDDGLWMKHLNIWRGAPEADEVDVRDSKQVAFLINGCDVASVSAATYTAVLPFAYFSSLKAVAVEFPLDNPRYNVILFLPTERPDTLRLARDLSSKSLRLLRKHLQPTWIRATIPSFMLKGFVTLTPFLQRLGIRDVFEPRAADLSPMTPDVGVYARDVQQSIGVNIRNYMEPDRTSSRESTQQEFPLIVPPRRDAYRFLYPGNGLLERAGPISFVAEHPFLYFIIDTETSVSLIAGRIDDPLNSRIL